MAFELDLPTHGFGQCVGGHNRLRSVEPVVCFEVVNGGIQSCNQSLHRQVLEYHACREWQHLAVVDAQALRQLSAGDLRIAHALRTCACIGAACVNHQGAYAVVQFQMTFAHGHGCGTKSVFGEHARYARAFGHGDDEHVFALGFAYASLCEAQVHARNRFELRCADLWKIDRH